MQELEEIYKSLALSDIVKIEVIGESVKYDIYPLKDIEYKTNNSYIKHFQLFLIEKYSLHMKLFPYLNLEKYPNLVLSIISLVNKILFFCEQLDIYEKGNCFLEKINPRDIAIKPSQGIFVK